MFELLTATILALLVGAAYGGAAGVVVALYRNVVLWARPLVLIVFIVVSFVGFRYLFAYFHVDERFQLMLLLWAVWLSPFAHAALEDY